MDLFKSPWAEDRLVFNKEAPGSQPESKEISLEGLSDLEKVAKLLVAGDETLARNAITLQLQEVQAAFGGEENRVWQIHDAIVSTVSQFGISREELEQIAPRAAEGTMGFLELVKRYLGLKAKQKESNPAVSSDSVAIEDPTPATPAQKDSTKTTPAQNDATKESTAEAASRLTLSAQQETWHPAAEAIINDLNQRVKEQGRSEAYQIKPDDWVECTLDKTGLSLLLSRLERRFVVTMQIEDIGEDKTKVTFKPTTAWWNFQNTESYRNKNSQAKNRTSAEDEPQDLPKSPQDQDVDENLPAEEPAEEGSPASPEPADLKPKEETSLPKTLEVKTRDELLSYVTPKNIAKHIKEGTVHELLLIIDASEHSGLIKNNYGEMIKRIVADIKELQEELDKASSLSVEQIKAALNGPLAELFKQKDLPVFSVNGLNEEQLRALYEVCLLEQHVRGKNIKYKSKEGDGGQFFSTLDPEGDGRTGDCSAVACYYASLVAAVNSSRLKSATKFTSVDGHAQIVFDLGGGKMISKNTSYVDMEKAKRNGTTNHNFYSFEADRDYYGLDDNKNIQSTDQFLIGALSELVEGSRYIRSKTSEELQRNLRLMEHIIKHDGDDPVALSNAISYRKELIKRGVLSDNKEMQDAMLADISRLIELSHYSALSIYNFKLKYGEQAAQPLIDQYADRLKADPKAFKTYILEPIKRMRSNPKFDHRVQYIYQSTQSVALENRQEVLDTVYQLSSDSTLKKLAYDLNEEILNERKTWKEKA